MDQISTLIIGEILNWVRSYFFESKGSKLKLSDLEKQVELLSRNNEVLSRSNQDLIQIILEKLKSEGRYEINTDTIVKADDNFTVQDAYKQLLSDRPPENVTLRRFNNTED